MSPEFTKNPLKIENLQVENNPTVHNETQLIENVINQKSTNNAASSLCRICHTNTANECLISPCNCKGTQAHIHLSCLERWLNQSSRNYCELCMFRYSAIETKRYKLWQSFKMWIRHPLNRAHVCSDLLIGVLLTMATSGLIMCIVKGYEYFVMEGTRLGVQKKWIISAIVVFLITVITVFVITMFVLLRDIILTWYKWWTSTVNIQLILPPSLDRTLTGKTDILNI
ncbi:E3 ubiquitin-protein ligase MARCHF3-like [Diabrotica virgifera virgifera]|uniref:RING-CH-type domain-containing protein n=1 Tax=Diabrotica virgifera virgifera TaxID=50390 RepID=A0ABM5IVZ0_DIAVI|nr:E3 ubiquitin-protein ligase MARCHF3-like [Diabrotica virgifera virgifera]